MNHVVVGLGWGDEGKGLITDHLCHPNSIVVRFSGGHQAGHTVVRDGFSHVFSNFGAGTLQGCKTFWSKYCTFFPVGVCNEYQALKAYSPELIVDPLAPVATFYDVFYNWALEAMQKHGSCGVGFAATVERNEGPCKFHVQDLMFPKIMKQKLEAIKRYYRQKMSGNPELIMRFQENDFAGAEKRFMDYCRQCVEIITLLPEKEFFLTENKKNTNFVFEGSQGILLDMDFGFFPNVTRSNTTSKNALEIVKRNNLVTPEINYVTRCYQTRHGNGWMSDESVMISNPLETNVQHEWQGKFRTGMIDVELIQYAIACDDNYSNCLTKNIAITCLDQKSVHAESLISEIGIRFNNIIKSYSNCTTDIGRISIAKPV